MKTRAAFKTFLKNCLQLSWQENLTELNLNHCSLSRGILLNRCLTFKGRVFYSCLLNFCRLNSQFSLKTSSERQKDLKLSNLNTQKILILPKKLLQIN